MGEVGFSTLADQMHRRVVKKGFSFTLMVLGERGLGKTTFLNSMFLRNFGKVGEEDVGDGKVRINTITETIEEKGVKLSVTVIESPGFSDAIDNTLAYKPAVDYIDQQFANYLEQENSVYRKVRSDTRVHVLVYFINPSNHGLKPIDIETLKALDKKVNIIPVIGKADTLTPAEKRRLKSQVKSDLVKNNIGVYQFPIDEDNELSDQNYLELQQAMPFAVVASEDMVEVKGKKVFARKYGWGIVEVENPSHCDFALIRNVLIRTHMQDLKEVTNEIHYENYRASILREGQAGGQTMGRNNNNSEHSTSIRSDSNGTSQFTKTVVVSEDEGVVDSDGPNGTN